METRNLNSEIDPLVESMRLIGYLSAIEQVLKAACEHDGGLFRRLSETLDELIIGPIANGERLAIKQPSAKEARLAVYEVVGCNPRKGMTGKVCPRSD
ncbi:hypothetical protein CLIM01_05662 [Colletotrichum limetticola]|uniref:Uncharacterized protein n=1 Tax=Colletotrichum limetticola TaxID=1209924 RepID=A0ABQ9PZW3_9PEZI|nr:hypothetical protein CLIM01_05662 [Colletotrichum limetticola]